MSLYHRLRHTLSLLGVVCFYEPGLRFRIRSETCNSSNFPGFGVTSEVLVTSEHRSTCPQQIGDSKGQFHHVHNPSLPEHSYFPVTKPEVPLLSLRVWVLLLHLCPKLGKLLFQTSDVFLQGGLVLLGFLTGLASCFFDFPFIPFFHLGRNGLKKILG